MNAYQMKQGDLERIASEKHAVLPSNSETQNLSDNIIKSFPSALTTATTPISAGTTTGRSG